MRIHHSRGVFRLFSSSGSSGGVPSFAVRPHLDYKGLRASLPVLRKTCEAKNIRCDLDRFSAVYDESFNLSRRIEELRAERKANARIAGVSRGKEIKEQLSELETRHSELSVELEGLGRLIPNLVDPSVPIGDESRNEIVFQSDVSFPGSGGKGESVKRDHVELARLCDLIDTEAASRVSGARFYYLKNEAALMELALVNYAVHFMVQKGWVPHITPDLVRLGVVQGCGFQPRGEAKQLYEVAESDLVLTATAEIPLSGIHMDSILTGPALPLKYVAFGRCFRTEIGHAGSENRGIYRVHQFSKVEMFAFCSPDRSVEFLESIRSAQMEFFESLDIPFRVLNMASGELGAPATKKYDIEGWMPGAGKWGELSSASNCTDYQARRLNIRVRESANDKPVFVHTLNGTVCAVPRTLIAIWENGQDDSGNIRVPKVLHPYMMNIDCIRPRAQVSPK
ncbi:mitochondrial seryl-tRNA synthetase (SerRS) [Andalucia godoyi]|uniref:serine--tRNA ligase n=1 Tax=Andalucia godoyi TaxID=505711 RepID=A0A8K0AJJ9_ANDGO|nr:mitochondrial seryl-tRNA synthetase (SerRS) [Andalucia godoyi]|eukprot:ANDGO_06055.mRNA.1 mitochondrial seryl-tRNA synthetase (SerRS)